MTGGLPTPQQQLKQQVHLLNRCRFLGHSQLCERPPNTPPDNIGWRLPRVRRLGFCLDRRPRTLAAITIQGQRYRRVWWRLMWWEGA